MNVWWDTQILKMHENTSFVRSILQLTYTTVCVVVCTFTRCLSCSLISISLDCVNILVSCKLGTLVVLTGGHKIARRKTSRMDNYDVAPLNSRAIRLGPSIAESDVDAMTINSVGPLRVGKSAEGSCSKRIYILLAHQSFNYVDLDMRG